MYYGQFSAILLSFKKIRIVLNNEKYREDDPKIFVFENNDKHLPFKIVNKVFQFRTNIYELELRHPIVLGNEYIVFIENYGRVALNVNCLPFLSEFDDLFNYTGPLGAHYSKEKTSFYLWAPLASRVILKYRKSRSKKWQYKQMERSKNGVYKTVLTGNQNNLVYRYLVVNSGLELEVTDPYAFGSTANGKDSVVVDLDSLKINMNDDMLPPFSSPTEMIIYETSVRDMTNDPRTNIRHKATYKGMIEKGRKSQRGGKVGFDYIKDLGITHMQLLPIYDFKTVNELDKWSSYNWGYDPAQYFVPEGSYSLKPNDPLSRIKELKEMVAAYHEVGIRISMDVVFNHVYEYETSVFDKIVPNYYFRTNDDGSISKGSGCGNDLATERPMVRRLIVDAALHFVIHYGIDAMRVDLMGLIDKETIMQIYTKARKIKPDFVMYGEGWNMISGIDEDELANLNNAFDIPEIGFFNDSFREIVKGGSFASTINERGYLLGAENYRLGFKFAYLGSTTNSTFEPKFLSAAQSINYVECHDNGTLIDKLLVSNGDEDLPAILRRIQMINTVVMLAFGVPFFHRGQEIGLSKYGDMNSYQSSDKVNNFAYALANKRECFVDYFKDLTKMRKECRFLHETDPEIIKEMVEFCDLEKGGILISYKNISDRSPYKVFNVFINISDEALFVSLDNPQKIILNNAGYIQGLADNLIRNLMIGPQSIIITGLRNE